jgi:hypothetical protein
MIVDYRKGGLSTSPILIDGAVVKQVESFKFLGIHITNKLTQQDSREEGTTKHIPPQETEKIWPGSSDPQKVLQLHHREHPDGLHHCLVWQLLGLRPQDTTKGCVYGPVHYWCQVSCHPGPLYEAVSEEGPKNGQTPATLVIDCSLCYRTESGNSGPRLGPRGFLTASTPHAIRLLKMLANCFPDYLHCPNPLFYAAATLCYYLCILTLITLPTCTY